jgi:hypothetical protein
VAWIRIVGADFAFIRWSSVMAKRRRFTQADQLEDRLAAEAKRLREKAQKLRPGPAREQLLSRAEQHEMGAHMSEWLRSPSGR